MRTFKTCALCALSVRSLLVVAGALTLMAALAPRANATLIRFYDMEGPTATPYPVGLKSDAPAVETGPATILFLDNGTPGMAYSRFRTSAAPGLPLNVPVGAAPNLTSLGLHRTGLSPLGMEIFMR